MPTRIKGVVRPFKLVPMQMRIVFLCLVAVLLIFMIVPQHQTRTKSEEWRQCYGDPKFYSPLSKWMSSIREKLKLPDIYEAPVKPNNGRKNIFFAETSCPQPREILNARQACAVESAALHNPNSNVFVLFAKPTYWNNSSIIKPRPLLDALVSYDNVHLRNVNLWKYADGSPMNEWLQRGAIFKFGFVDENVSNLLRYLTLWRWGGTFLSLDSVVLRSLEDLPANYAALGTKSVILKAVINFDDQEFGHYLATACLEYMKTHYNGCMVITRVIKYFCNSQSVGDLVEHPEQCNGFNVLNSTSFYPIPSNEWTKLFIPCNADEVYNRTRDSYAVHMWDKLSARTDVEVDSRSAYAQLAEQHCPKVFAANGYKI